MHRGYWFDVEFGGVIHSSILIGNCNSTTNINKSKHLYQRGFVEMISNSHYTDVFFSHKLLGTLNMLVRLRG